MYGLKKGCIQIVDWETRREQTTIKTQACMRKDNFKMDHQDINGGMDWIDVTHKIDKLWAFMNTVMNIRSS